MDLINLKINLYFIALTITSLFLDPDFGPLIPFFPIYSYHKSRDSWAFERIRKMTKLFQLKMSDQFGSNLNSLEYALTGHNEQEFIENLQIDIPKMEHQPAIIEMERLEQPSNVSPTVSPRIENPQKQTVPDQQNILVSFELHNCRNFPTIIFCPN